jgi:Tfp pilus assembly protein PilF
MTTAFSFFITLSLILGAAGCQTLKDNQDGAAKEESKTDLSIARAFLEAGSPDKAMFELRSVLEREPSNPQAHGLMGLAQLALKNPRKAVQHLEMAWKLDPKSEAALNLSSGYIESKQYDLAQKIITSGLSLKETPPYRNKERFYHNLGLLAERKGSLVAAEKAYRKALEENPTFYLSRARLATILDEKHKPDEAKTHWEIARNSCPGCFDATNQLVKYYLIKGDLKTALGLVQDYKKIEGLNPVEARKATELEGEILGNRSKTASGQPRNQSR